MVYLDEKAIQQLIEAFNRRDWEPGSKLFAEDAILHCPGKNRISGDHSGKHGILDFGRNSSQYRERASRLRLSQFARVKEV
jgi:hypothetical protein